MCVKEAALQACSSFALRVGRARLQGSSWGDTVWDHDHRNGLRHFGRTPGCGYNPERSINTVSIGDDKDWNRTRHSARRNQQIIS